MIGTGRYAPIFVVVAILSVTACGEKGKGEAVRGPMETDILDGPADGGAVAQAAPVPSAMQASHIARSYEFELSVPSGRIASIQKLHIEECVKLGCMVLETSVNLTDRHSVWARSTVRIAPAALDKFVSAITAAPAQIRRQSETAEDKTLPILEVEKRLEVKSALRDRLRTMLTAPGTKTATDLAAIEKELAQVQGDIETATAQRDYLRTITETVKVDINYTGSTARAGGVDFSPVSYAITSIGDTIVSSVAALIGFLAAVLPWLPIIALVVWGGRKAIGRWRARREQS